MKKLPIAIAIAGSFAFFGCRGDHSANSGRDTAELKLPAPKSTDTSKITAPDNSGNGGTTISKDTSKTKKR